MLKTPKTYLARDLDFFVHRPPPTLGIWNFFFFFLNLRLCLKRIPYLLESLSMYGAPVHIWCRDGNRRYNLTQPVNLYSFSFPSCLKYKSDETGRIRGSMP